MSDPAKRTALFLVLSVAGCEKAATVPKPEGQVAGGSSAPAADAWKAAAQQLRRDPDLANCRAALNKLNGDIVSRPGTDAPAALAPAAAEALAAYVPLTEQDAGEIRSAAFSALDAQYLAECLYLRDAARALDVAGLPPERQAERAFAWVCRQVELRPWPPQAEKGPRLAVALPPSAVLPRGHGSGLERAYVFLGLLRQLDIDGCLIGPPNAGDNHAGLPPAGPGGRPFPEPRGPFLAVGARVGKDVFLFDPWRGEPYPAPAGKGAGTLAALKAEPAPLKAWIDGGGHPSPYAAEAMKAALVYLSVPLNALAPRMQWLEDKLSADVAVRLAFGPTAVRGRFVAETGVEPRPAFWNPPGDRFALPRTLAAYLPVEEGGWDRTPAGPDQLRTANQWAQVPRSQFRLPPELRSANERFLKRVKDAAEWAYMGAFVVPAAADTVPATAASDSSAASSPVAAPAAERPSRERSAAEPWSPRERIQRGRFEDAARTLVEKQGAFQRGLDASRSEHDLQTVRAWIAQVNESDTSLGRAQLNKDPVGEAEARSRLNSLWQADAGPAQLLVERVVGPAAVAEAAFLLALCKHEVAERAQGRWDRAAPSDKPRLQADAREAWTVARDAWASFAFRAGRQPRAMAMSDRAAAMADAAGK